MKTSRTREQHNTGFGVDKPNPIGQGALEVGAFGRLWLVWSRTGLVTIDFSDQNGRAPGVPVGDVPSQYRDPLRRYFSGRSVDPACLSVDLHGTPFQVRVWNALRRVPRGRVRSYQGIASDVGSPRAMRAVGMANKKNPVPIVVPCHRIVSAGHGLGGYSGGLDKKRFLLELEGVRVEGDRVLPGQLELF